MAGRYRQSSLGIITVPGQRCSAMSRSLPTFYLPITVAVARDFFNNGRVPDAPVERSALMAALLALHTDIRSFAALGDVLRDTQDIFFGPERDRAAEDLSALRNERLSAETLAQSVDSLADQGVFFATESQMAQGLWRGANGHYTDAFQERCRDTLVDQDVSLADDREDLDADEYFGDEEDQPRSIRERRILSLNGTLDQVRAATVIAANASDPITISATAGSGKTHLMLLLAEKIRGGYTHLAPTKAHRDAFLHRAGRTAILSKTLANVAHDAAAALIDRRSGTRLVRPPRIGDSMLSLAEQADRIRLPAIGNTHPAGVLAAIYSALRSWSCGEDFQIAHGHFGWRLQPTERDAYVGAAHLVWDRMFEPRDPRQELVLSIKLYHLVKWLDLQEAALPAMGTLLIDEAHDLPAPWYGLLQRYPSGWLAMGDPYQRITGRASQAARAKSLVMTQSVRAGVRLEPMIRRTLGMHDGSLIEGEFRGSRNRATRYHAYGQNADLPLTGLRAYGNVWALLEDALRVKAKGAQFRMLPASEKVVDQMTKEAILLRKYGDRPTHYHLRRFTQWDDFADHLARTGYSSLVRMFEKGFSVDDLNVLRRGQAPDGEQQLTLGLLEHCKNMEFSQVAMSQSCFISPNERPKNELVKGVYVAMTRVQNELWTPGDALDRLSDQLKNLHEDSEE